MAAKIKYVSPEGALISREEVHRIKAERPDAWDIHKFENDKFVVTLSRAVIADNGLGIPEKYRAKCHLVVELIIREDFEGRPHPKPLRVTDVDATKDFISIEKGEAAYRKFLCSYTDCRHDEMTGQFVEVGNKLSPDVPRVAAPSSKAQPNDFGSW